MWTALHIIPVARGVRLLGFGRQLTPPPPLTVGRNLPQRGGGGFWEGRMGGGGMWEGRLGCSRWGDLGLNPPPFNVMRVILLRCVILFCA